MKIQEMFRDDINRPINGVVQVEQDTERVIVQELNEYVVTKELKKHFITLPTLIALCSIALSRPVQSSMVVIGDFSIGGTIMKAENLPSTLQICLDSGAKKVLLPTTSFADMATVPPELMSAFQLIPYSSAEDAVFKALGVE